MKRLLPLLLILLLLAGCGSQAPEDTLPTGEQTEPVIKSLYDPTSDVEAQTNGAVRLYRLEQNNNFAVSAMGNRLILRAEDGILTVLQGNEGTPVASLSTGCSGGILSVNFDSAVQGAAYYNRELNQIVLVNPQLQETDRIDLPEDMQGAPYICLSKGEIYYCVPGEIRALNIQSGISRLIRSHSYGYQQLMGIHFGGEMLECELMNEDKSESMVEYISTETGKTLYDGPSHLYPLYTWQDSYLLNRNDGGVSQKIIGTRDSQAQALLIPDERIASALPMGGAIGYTRGADIDLSFYDLESGKCTARVTLPGISAPVSFLPTQNGLWILAKEGEQQVLCYWDPTMSPVEEDTVYTGKLHTADSPDTEGLAACKARADQMSQKYAVKIHIWQDALQVTGDYDVTGEYQVKTVNRMLDELEVALQQFPKDFLRKTVEAGWIHVNLVRSLGTNDTYAQYWYDGDCYISITNIYNATEDFYRGVAYAIDSHVLGNSRKFDDWNKFNPEGFTYSYSDEPREDQDTYLRMENSPFLSPQALAYPHDDRADVFFHAVTASGEYTFQSDVMQAKLECLCRAIREAYGLEKSEQTYLWEQYLTESLAYKK